MDDQRACPHCSREIGEAAGKCPYCGGDLNSTTGADVASSTASDEGKCPYCSAELKPGDIICIQCGTNLLTGERVLAARAKPARRRRGALVEVVVVLALVVVAGVAAAVWYLRHDYASEGRRLFLEGRLMEAGENYDKAIARNDREPRLFLESGLVELGRENYATAIERFGRVMELDPENKRAQLLLGVSNALAGKTLTELSALEQAATMDPENGELHYILGLAYTIAERRED